MTALLANKRELMNLSDANVGDELEFEYCGANDMNYIERNATVLEIREDGVIARDLSIPGVTNVRNFVNRHASDVFVLDAKSEVTIELDFQAVRDEVIRHGAVPAAVVNLLTGEQLSDVYSEYVEPEAKLITYNSVTGLFYITHPLREATFGVVLDNTVYIDAVNGDKHQITLDPHTDCILFNGYVVTPKELAEKLTAITA